jgi:hypothetical protein
MDFGGNYDLKRIFKTIRRKQDTVRWPQNSVQMNEDNVSSVRREAVKPSRAKKKGKPERQN